jgi:hypothetical protein
MVIKVVFVATPRYKQTLSINSMYQSRMEMMAERLTRSMQLFLQKGLVLKQYIVMLNDCGH